MAFQIPHKINVGPNHLNFDTGFSSSDGNGDDYQDKTWSVPSSAKTIHGFDLSQVQDLEKMDNPTGVGNGATVTGELEIFLYW